MNRDFLPTRDSLLVTYLQNLSAGITAGAAGLGILPAQATTFAGLVSDLVDAYAVCMEPTTRTKGTIGAKNVARKEAKAYARQLVRIIQANPAVTVQQKLDLNLPVHDDSPSPINPPTEYPDVKVPTAIGRILKAKLSAQDSERRGKPDGVAGAAVWTFVGAEAPADIADWTYFGSSTRTDFDIEFPPSVAAGSQVFICAAWFSPRNQLGPISPAISAYIAGGVSASAAA